MEALFGIGCAIAVFGHLLFLIAGLRNGFIWVIAMLFLPGATLLFLAFHWDDGKRPLAVQIVGIVLVVLGAAGAPGEEMEESEEEPVSRIERRVEEPARFVFVA